MLSVEQEAGGSSAARPPGPASCSADPPAVSRGACGFNNLDAGSAVAGVTPGGWSLWMRPPGRSARCIPRPGDPCRPAGGEAGGTVELIRCWHLRGIRGSGRLNAEVVLAPRAAALVYRYGQSHSQVGTWRLTGQLRDLTSSPDNEVRAGVVLTCHQARVLSPRRTCCRARAKALLARLAQAARLPRS